MARTKFTCLFNIFIIINVSLSIPLINIDLTHTLSPLIPYFPTQVRFNFTQHTRQEVDRKHSFFYATNAFVTSEHMGTHIDAPFHFSPSGWKVDEIPLEHLISVNAYIIDVSQQCEKDRNYLITVDDVRNEDIYIPETDADTGRKFLFVLIFYTGWTKYWPDQNAYAGGKSQLEFPGLSEGLAAYLIETYQDNLVGVGIDTLSTDYGLSTNFLVHQTLAYSNLYGLENLALNASFVRDVRNTFFKLDVYPMKIANGTGAPSRIVAHIKKLKKHRTRPFTRKLRTQ